MTERNSNRCLAPFTLKRVFPEKVLTKYLINRIPTQNLPGKDSDTRNALILFPALSLIKKKKDLFGGGKICLIPSPFIQNP